MRLARRLHDVDLQGLARHCPGRRLLRVCEDEPSAGADHQAVTSMVQLTLGTPARLTANRYQ